MLELFTSCQQSTAFNTIKTILKGANEGFLRHPRRTGNSTNGNASFHPRHLLSQLFGLSVDFVCCLGCYSVAHFLTSPQELSPSFLDLFFPRNFATSTLPFLISSISSPPVNHH